MKLRLPLALSAAIIAACTFTSVSSAAVSGNSISINFASDYASVSGADLIGIEEVAADNWNNASGGTEAYSTETDKFNTDTTFAGSVIDNQGNVLSTTIKWKSGTGGTYRSGNSGTQAEKLQYGYLDSSGNSVGSSLSATDIPYLMSTVYIMCAGDTNAAYGTFVVNGISYRAIDGETVEGTGTWGERGAKNGVWEEGINYLKVNIVGIDLSIASPAVSGARNSVAALQIVDAYEGNLTSHTLGTGTLNNWSSVVAADSDAQTFLAHASGSMLNVGTATTEGIILASGTLTLNGASLTLTGVAAINAFGGTTLNIDTTLIADGAITLSGGGQIVLRTDQAWDSIGGLGTLVINNGITLSLTGDNRYFSGALAGSGKVTGGSDDFVWQAFQPAGSTGTVDFNRGTLIVGTESNRMGSFTAGSPSTGAPFTAGNDGIDYTLNITSINAALVVYAVGQILDTNANGNSATISLSGNQFATVEIRSGYIRVNGSDFGDSSIILDTGGVVFTANNPTLDTDIFVADGGGYIRVYSNQTAYITGNVTGAGMLTKNDSGIINITDLSNFDGTYRNGYGTTNFHGTTNLTNLLSAAGTTTVNGTATLDSVTASGGTLNLAGNVHAKAFGWTGGTVNIAGDVRFGGSASDDLLSVSLEGSEFNINGTLTGDNVRLSFLNATMNINGDVTVQEFVMNDGGGKVGVINLESGSLNVTGSRNNEGRNSSILISHWQGSGMGTLNISGGEFNALDAIVYITTSWAGGSGAWNMSDGTANVKGVWVRVTEGKTSTLDVSGGRINIGDSGIIGTGAEGEEVNLGAGILGALDDWSSNAHFTLTNDVTGITFNTENISNPSGAGHTITLNGILSGDGALIKDGNGTLVLNGANTFEGGITLKNGTLHIKDNDALGLDGSRDLIIGDKGTGAGAILTSSTGSLTLDSFTMNEGGSLNLGGGQSGFVLNVNNSSTWTMGTGATLTLGTDSLIDINGSLTMTGTLNLAMNLGNLNDGTYILMMSTGGINIGTINTINTSSSDYRDPSASVYVDNNNLVLKIEDGHGLLTWTGSTGTWSLKGGYQWNTDKADKQFYYGDNVIFDDTAGGSSQTVTIDGRVETSDITINNTNVEYLFSGGTIDALGDITKSGGGKALFNGVTINSTGLFSIEGGTLALGNGTTLTITGTFENSGLLEFDGGTLNVLEIADSVFHTGPLSVASGSTGTITYGSKNLIVSAGPGNTNLTGLIWSGTGYIMAEGNQQLNLSNITSRLYAGATNVHITGTNTGAIFGGSWETQIAASGKVTIGSINNGVKTTVGTGVYGASHNIGSTLADGEVNPTVLSQIEILGGMTKADFLDADGELIVNANDFNTYIGTRLYGGPLSGGISIHGSTELTISGAYFKGTNPDFINGNYEVLVAGGDVNSKIMGNSTLTVKNSYIDSKVFGTGGYIYGSLTYNFEDSYVKNNIMLTGSGGSSGVYGDVIFNDSGSYFNGSIYGARDTFSAVRNASLIINMEGSTVAGNITLGASHENMSYAHGSSVTLDGVTIKGSLSASSDTRSFGGDLIYLISDSAIANLYAAGTGAGNYTGDLTIDISGASRITNFVGGLYNGDGTFTGDLSITVGGTTNISKFYGAGGMGATESSKGVFTGDLNILIEGNAVIGNYMSVGHGSGKAVLDGNILLEITGGTIGSGLTGTTNANMFILGGQDSFITGDATLNMSGGSILNQAMIMASVGSVEAWGGKGGIGGNATLNLSGGTIESSIFATSGYNSQVGGDLNITLSGGILGRDGQTRTIDMGVAGGGNSAGWGSNEAVETVAGNVNITLDGGLNGEGATFEGNYSILGGATHHKGTGVAGDVTITLSNITAQNPDDVSGVANFGGIISGANATGGGVAASSARKLVFDNYAVEANALFQYFTLAAVTNNSNVYLQNTANTAIDSWEITGNSTLNIVDVDALGDATAMQIDSGSKLSLEAGTSQTFSAVLTGDGTFAVATNGNMLTLDTNSSSFTGTATLGNNSTITLTGSGSLGNGSELNLSASSKLVTSKAGDFILGTKLTGSGSIEINNSQNIRTTLTNADSSFSGNFTVTGGILELADVVGFSSSSVMISSGATAQILGNNLDTAFNAVTGNGTFLIKNNNTLTENVLSAFAGTVSIDSGLSLTVNQTGSSSLLSSSATLNLKGNSTVNFVNNSSLGTITLDSIVLENTGNLITLGGADAFDLVITTQDWMLQTSGEVSFDIAGGFFVLTGDESYGVYSNIFVIENGYYYQARTNGAGALVKLTIDDMTELPAAGANDSTGIYRITEANDDLVGGVLTMTDSALISSLNIVSSADNTGWNLDVHAIDFANAALFFQGDEDYLIEGGTLRGSDTQKKLDISQTSETNTLTITSAIGNNSNNDPTLLQKLGGGTLILGGSLVNTGGINVVNGTLQLQDAATGSSSTGVLTVYGGATLVLGNGTDSYVPAFAAIVNDIDSDLVGGTIIVTNGATLGNGLPVTNSGLIKVQEGGTITSLNDIDNNGTVEFDLGGSTSTQSGTLSGTGLLKVSSGTAILSGDHDHRFEATGDGVLQFDLIGGTSITGAMTGNGTIVYANAAGVNLDFNNPTLAGDFSNFEGTLRLDAGSGSNTLRLRFNQAIGIDADNIATVDVRNGAQFWDDAADDVVRTNNWILSGTGEGQFGALRITQGGSYTGDISVDLDNGASIGGASTNEAIFSGDISGGHLSLGSGSNSYQAWAPIITLTGDNSHSMTTVNQGTVNANSSTALGGGLILTYDTSLVNINTHVAIGSLNSTADSSSVTISEGFDLTLDGSSNSTFRGILAGQGSLVLDGTGVVNLGGANTFSGGITINSGTLIAGSASALGASAKTVTVHDGASLDLSNRSFSQSITAYGGSSLSGLGAYGGELTLQDGAADNRVSVQGNTQAGSLILKHDAWAEINGNLIVTNGGRLFLNASNVDQGDAMIVTTGTASLGGEFKIKFDTNDYYNDASVTYYILDTVSGTVANYGGLEFTMDMLEAYKKFFVLEDTYLDDFLGSGKLSVTINRLVVEGSLIFESQGGDQYYAQTPVHYLGAERDENVQFIAKYHMADIDDSYRLTNGLGWLTFDSETQLVDKDSDTQSSLIINEYLDPTAPESRGVIMVNKNNTFTGGTHIYNVHVKSDANGAEGDTVMTFSTGEITLLGNTAHFELTTSSADESAAYTYANDFLITDGSLLSQTNGANTITGNVAITEGGAGGVIANYGDQDLVLAGGLYGGDLTIQGGGTGQVVLTNAISQEAARLLDTLSLSDNASFALANEANLRVGTVDIEQGSNLVISTGSVFTLYGGSATGDGSIIMDGGTLRVTRSLTLGGAGNASVSFNAQPFSRTAVTGSVIDVINGTTLTINDPTAAANSSFTKTGMGTLLFDGDNSGYLGTAIVHEGLMEINATTNFNFGGNIEIGGSDTGARVKAVEGLTVQGNLILNNNAELTTGNNFTVDGDFILRDNAVFETSGKITLKGDVIVGNNGMLTLSEGTTLGYDNTTITIGQGSTLHFGTGKGSQLAGNLLSPLTFSSGSSYEGFLNAGNNMVIFEEGSSYIVSGSLKYKEVSSVTGALQSRSTIILNEGMTFNMDNFTEDNLSRYANGFCLISVSDINGQILIQNGDGDLSNLVESADYSYMLGQNNYDWLQFALIGGSQGKTLDLDVFIQAHYELLGGTSNERAIAPAATYIANNFGELGGELKSLGANLALASGNSSALLTSLSLSTSSAMAAYQVQMSNLRRHSFEIFNRAVQEYVGEDRLSHEQHFNTVWANGIGGTYKLDGDANAVGNTTNVWGGTVGYSKAFTGNLTAGIAFTYANSDTKMDDGMGSSDADSYYIDLFARYRKNNWNFVGVLTGGMTSVDFERSTRVGSYGALSKASADGHQIYALLQAGYEFSVSRDDRSILEPFALISGGYSSIDGYTESNAGNAGLIVDSQSQGLATIGAGVRFIRTYFTDTNELRQGRFEARAMVLQDLTDMDVKVDASFIGAPGHRFSQEGATPGKTSFVIGAGVVIPVTNQTSLFADIDGEFRNSETGVRANVGVKYSF